MGWSRFGESSLLTRADCVGSKNGFFGHIHNPSLDGEELRR
jgi:hypothetical protein